MKKAALAMAAGVIIFVLSSCGQKKDLDENQTYIMDSSADRVQELPSGTTMNEGEPLKPPDKENSDVQIKNDGQLEILAGEYEYHSDYGTGRLIIKKTDCGYDISDYESESSYRFLADSSNIDIIENNKIYMKYPEQVLSDGSVIFSWYILKYNTDGIDVYHGKSADETQFLYHASKKGEQSLQDGQELIQTSQGQQEEIQSPQPQTEERTDDGNLLYEAFLKNETGVRNPYVEGMKLTVMDDKNYESEFEDAEKTYAYVDVNSDDNPELIFKISSGTSELMYILGIYDSELICFDVFETHTPGISFGVYDYGFVWEVQNYDGFQMTVYTYTADGQPVKARRFTEESGADIAAYEGEEPQWIDWQAAEEDY